MWLRGLRSGFVSLTGRKKIGKMWARPVSYQYSPLMMKVYLSKARSLQLFLGAAFSDAHGLCGVCKVHIWFVCE